MARRLFREGIECKNIVILSPYRAQCSEISNKLKEHGLKDIFVSSVVAAQGKCVNFSFHYCIAYLILLCIAINSYNTRKHCMIYSLCPVWTVQFRIVMRFE